MNDIAFNQELDCRGLNCPLPILKTKKAIDGMSSGDILKMVSTDPGSKNDISAWANLTGNALLSSGEHGSDFVYYIQKS